MTLATVGIIINLISSDSIIDVLACIWSVFFIWSVIVKSYYIFGNKIDLKKYQEEKINAEEELKIYCDKYENELIKQVADIQEKADKDFDLLKNRYKSVLEDWKKFRIEHYNKDFETALKLIGIKDNNKFEEDKGTIQEYEMYIEEKVREVDNIDDELNELLEKIKNIKINTEIDYSEYLNKNTINKNENNKKEIKNMIILIVGIFLVLSIIIVLVININTTNTNKSMNEKAKTNTNSTNVSKNIQNNGKDDTNFTNNVVNIDINTKNNVKKLYNEISDYGSSKITDVAYWKSEDGIPSMLAVYSDTDRKGKYIIVMGKSVYIEYGDEKVSGNESMSKENRLSLFKNKEDYTLLTGDEFRSIIK